MASAEALNSRTSSNFVIPGGWTCRCKSILLARGKAKRSKSLLRRRAATGFETQGLEPERITSQPSQNPVEKIQENPL
jgi:hypothetical protein